MFSAAQYNLSNSSNNLSVSCLGRLLQTLVSITPESSLNFSLLRKFGPYFPHRAMWRCCPSMLLEEYVSQQTCCLSFLRTTLTPEVEMSCHCFSLHFTWRARGWRYIPFWVTHTSTELSTEGQVPRTNSSLAWTYTKQLSTFSLWQQSSTGPAWAERLCNLCPWRFSRIHLNKVLHNPFWPQSMPCWKQKVELETSDTPSSLCFPMNLLTWASSSDLIELTLDDEIEEGREGGVR